MVGTLELLRGSIVDSWLERQGSVLVVQMSPTPAGREIWLVEAPARLVDHRWLQDLAENLCHGSPIAAYGSWGPDRTFRAERLSLER